MNAQEQRRYEDHRAKLKRQAYRVGIEYPPGTTWWPELQTLKADERRDLRARIAARHGELSEHQLALVCAVSP